MKTIDITVAEDDLFLSTASVEQGRHGAGEHALLIRGLSQVADSLITSTAFEAPADQALLGQAADQLEFCATPKLVKAVKSQLQEYPWPQTTRSLLQEINSHRQSGIGISVAVEVVDSSRITELNTTFRDKDSATNVLSFPASDAVEDDEFQQLAALMMEQDESYKTQVTGEGEQTEGLNIPDAIPLGDIVLCRAVIESEARAQSKSFEAHWVHLATHGLLHLFGFSHHDHSSASCMESLEICLLEELGHNNPYIET